jgi:hypothetical protein
MIDASLTDRQQKEHRMPKRTSFPASYPEARADTAAQAIVQVLTAAMASWAATIRLSVACAALVLATSAGVIIVHLLGR